MPKIIEPGTKIDRQDPFSYRVGLRASCPGCGCKWEVEETDHFNAVVQDRPLSGIFVRCPNCGFRCVVHPPHSYADGTGQVQIR